MDFAVLFVFGAELFGLAPESLLPGALPRFGDRPFEGSERFFLGAARGVRAGMAAWLFSGNLL